MGLPSDLPPLFHRPFKVGIHQRQPILPAFLRLVRMLSIDTPETNYQGYLRIMVSTNDVFPEPVVPSTSIILRNFSVLRATRRSTTLG
jgi:hypothetical protein